MPDQNRPFQIEADASQYAYGAVLTQTDSNGKRHPVCFLSRSFSPAEQNYQVFDRELLGVIRALEEWKHYILGSPHMTVVHSDHKNLTYWRSPQNLNRRQARWFLILSEYDIKLEHMPGHKMIQSDALSRRPDLIPEGENEENTDITMLPETLFINLIDTELQKQITEARPLDKNTMEALETLLRNTNVTSGTSINDWSFEEGDHRKLLFYKDKVYVPNDQELRKSIVMHFHDPVTAGHPGQIETYNAVATSYWWPGMRRFISAYVKGCSTCQQFKINRNPARPTLMPIPAPESLK